jgi:hypothetical protein
MLYYKLLGDPTHAKVFDIAGSKRSVNKNTKMLKPHIDRPISAMASEACKPSANSVFERMLYPDITFIVGDTEFTAHKYVLAARSSFFENMFSSKEISNGVMIY